jgi:hypothetical protein
MAALGVAFLYFIGLVVGWIPSQTEVCEYNQYTSKNECASYDTTVAIMREVSRLLNYNAGAIAGVASIFIAVFTWSLWVSTDLLWREAQAQRQAATDALKLASDEFNATHRPRLIVKPHNFVGRIWDPRWSTEPGPTPPEGNFALLNIGDATATIIRSRFYMQFCRHFPFTFVPLARDGDTLSLKDDLKLDLAGTQVRPGEMVIWHKVFRNIGGEAGTYNSYTDKDLGLFLIVQILYEGPDKITRQTVVFRRFDVTTRDMERVASPDLEYNE